MFLIMVEQLQGIRINLKPSKLPYTAQTREIIRQLVGEIWERHSRFAPEGVYFPRTRRTNEVKS